MAEAKFFQSLEQQADQLAPWVRRLPEESVWASDTVSFADADPTYRCGRAQHATVSFSRLKGHSGSQQSHRTNILRLLKQGKEGQLGVSGV